MDRLVKSLSIVSILIIWGCGGSGGSNTQPSTNAQSQQLQQLNSLTTRQGDVALDFNHVDSVEEYLLTPYPVTGEGNGSGTTTSGGSGSTSGSGSTNPTGIVVDPPVITDPPPPAHYVRVAGTTNFTIANPDGTTTSIPALASTAVFPAEIKGGAACLTTALAALNSNESLDIKGQGVLVQIPYNYCPPNEACAQPQATAGAQFTTGVMLQPSDEADAVVSTVLSLPPTLPILPIWIYPNVGVYFSSLDSCTSGSVTVGNP